MIKRFLVPLFALLACALAANPASAAPKSATPHTSGFAAKGSAQVTLRSVREDAVRSCRHGDPGRFLAIRYARRACVEGEMTRAVAEAALPTLSADYENYRAAHFVRTRRTQPTLYRPADDELAAYFPKAARARGISGTVRLDCVVQDDYRLNCTVASQPRVDLGWSEAALQTAGTFRAAHHFRGQSSVGAHMVVPILFRHPDDEGAR